MPTPHGKAQSSHPQTFLLWGDNANHCTYETLYAPLNFCCCFFILQKRLALFVWLVVLWPLGGSAIINSIIKSKSAFGHNWLWGKYPGMQLLNDQSSSLTHLWLCLYAVCCWAGGAQWVLMGFYSGSGCQLCHKLYNKLKHIIKLCKAELSCRFRWYHSVGW